MACAYIESLGILKEIMQKQINTAELEGGYLEFIRTIRRMIHSRPELGDGEHITQALICSELKSLDIPFTTHDTGVIARIDCQKQKTVAYRADMDALPMEEVNTCDYRSEVPGVMHACGHDGHTALLLGFARYCRLNLDKLAVNIVLIFQPAEESIGGAERMIAAGALSGVQEIYAVHVSPDISAGTIALCGGAAMAGAYEFDLEFYGKSSHGAQKDKGADALAACMETVMGIEAGLPRHLRDKALFHTGRVSGGTARNIVADRCSANCTFRYFEKKHLTEFMSVVDANINYAGSRYGVRGERVQVSHYIPLFNSRVCADKIRRLYPGVVEAPRQYTAEDFAFYADKVKGCLVWLGVNTGEEPKKRLHSPDFDFDESALIYGLQLYIYLATTGD